MPTVMTFTSLQQDVRNYLERGDSEDTVVYGQLPRLINLAERAIARKLKIEGFINVVTSDLVAGTSVYAKPDRWRRTLSMHYSNVRTPIFARSYEYCRTFWPDVTLRAPPQFYSDYNYTHWLIVPTPVATVPWEILYYEQPALLDDTNQTNWLTNYGPNALLYRTLLECEPFLKNDERIGVWKGLYDEAISDMNAEDISRIMDRAAVRQEA